MRGALSAVGAERKRSSWGLKGIGFSSWEGCVTLQLGKGRRIFKKTALPEVTQGSGVDAGLSICARQTGET